MKFLVTGQNRDTGARQTLEIAADSKAAAEKKAASTGMTVNRVEPIPDPTADVDTSASPAAKRSGFPVRLVIWLALLALAAVLFLIMTGGRISFDAGPFKSTP